MLRFIVYAVPLLILLLALFGFTVELLDAEPRSGSVIKLALFEQPSVPGKLVIGAWLVEASGLIALFLLAQGRFAAWWLDGLVAGWVAWVFRGPLLVITIVVAARQPQDPWWKLAFGWWVLYSVCGLSLAILARRSKLEPWIGPGAPQEEGKREAVQDEVEPRQPTEPEPVEAPAPEPEDPDAVTATVPEPELAEAAVPEQPTADDGPETEPPEAKPAEREHGDAEKA